MKKMLSALLWMVITIFAHGVERITITHTNACWHNTETDAWEWGFFKDFAVHGARQWQYASVKEGRKKTAVTLRSGKETLQLEIRY